MKRIHMRSLPSTGFMRPWKVADRASREQSTSLTVAGGATRGATSPAAGAAATAARAVRLSAVATLQGMPRQNSLGERKLRAGG
jgi:hypothetical protein